MGNQSTLERGLPQMSHLIVENLSKSFGGVQAVSGVSLEVKEGEIIGIIGNEILSLHHNKRYFSSLFEYKLYGIKGFV